MEMGWRWDFTIEILPQMAIATLNTILAAGVGYAIALFVGLLFLLGQRTPSKIINWINREIVEFELAAPTDLAGVRIPKRQCTRSVFPSIGTFVQ